MNAITAARRNFKWLLASRIGNAGFGHLRHSVVRFDKCEPVGITGASPSAKTAASDFLHYVVARSVRDEVSKDSKPPAIMGVEW